MTDPRTAGELVDVVSRLGEIQMRGPDGRLWNIRYLGRLPVADGEDEDYTEKPAELNEIPALAYVNGDIVIFRPADNGWFSIFSEQQISDERVNALGRYLEPTKKITPADVADGLRVDTANG